MLNMISVKTFTKRLNGETATFIALPTEGYEALEADLSVVKHLQPIKDIDFDSGAGGILLKCNSKSDALLGVAYTMKKYELYMRQNRLPQKVVEEDFEIIEDKDYSKDDEDEDECATDLIKSSMYDEDGNIKAIPAISPQEFAQAFMNSSSYTEGSGKYTLFHAQGEQYRKPYWVDGNFPLAIINLDNSQIYNMPTDINCLKAANRFVILVTIEDSKVAINRELRLTFMNNFEQRVLFELDFGICNLYEPSADYYNLILNESTVVNGYELSKELDKSKVIEDLKNYRGAFFDSARDIELLIFKIVKKKHGSSKIITKEDFDKILTARHLKKDSKEYKTTVEKELDSLIGLSEVKDTLSRIVSSLKFAKRRRASGLKTLDSNLGIVFMGNPGTAKTTTARILGRWLAEENILSTGSFREITRKDIIGKWVGWTAPAVAQAFESAKGGVLFIDEAYSLLGTEGSDGYSDECLAEIVTQMENNPDVLVIFAGYSSLMRDFIKRANPGLRSRLSNVVEFKDYSPTEMVSIFEYLLVKEEYNLGDKENATNTISQFVEDMNKLGSENLGNGRMMRRLFKSSVAHMAEREDNDLKTISDVDISKACSELMASEQLVSSQKRLTPGF